MVSSQRLQVVLQQLHDGVTKANGIHGTGPSTLQVCTWAHVWA